MMLKTFSFGGGLGKDRVWLSSKVKPLTQITTDLTQLSLPAHEEMCESGYCFV